MPITILIAGCFTGKIFDSRNKDKIEVGKTTINEAIILLGKPFFRQTMFTSTGNYVMLKYFFSKQYTYTRSGAGISVRLFYLEFKNDTLNAKIYDSSFKEDLTGFPNENYKNIKISQSDKKHVLNLLGNPSGVALCPSYVRRFSEKCRGASLIWSWVYNDPIPEKSKIINVSFDEKGTVIAVDVVMSLNEAPFTF